MRYIHQVKVPMLVLQGENDTRVPKEAAEQVVNVLKKDGKTVDAHYYAAEGHGFQKRENQIDAIQRTVEWFDNYLKGSGSGAWHRRTGLEARLHILKFIA
ncbi:MAG: alpha/beta hydrolase family protein [Terriglobales bacterium]